MLRYLLTAFTCFLTYFGQQVTADVQDFEFASVKLMPQVSELLVHIDTNSEHFSLRLQPDNSVFSSDFVFDDGVKQSKELSNAVRLYRGHITDNPSARVIASLANQRFEAAIFFSDKSAVATLFIEDGRRYSHSVDCSKDTFYVDIDAPQYCTIAYRDSSMNSHANRSKRSTKDESLGICGWSSPEVESRLRDYMSTTMHSHSLAVTEIEYEPKAEGMSRSRRAVNNGLKVCTLNVQIDSTLWALYSHDFNNNAILTRAALMRLAADLVQGVNEIYAASSFSTGPDDGSLGPFSGFQFQIAKFRIFTPEEVCNSTDSVIKQLCVDFIDSDSFLKINSQMDQKDYCLSYIISHRLFSGGVMGLAWLGYPSGYVGGVCQRPTNANGAVLSYNTGIITGNNQGSRVSKRGLTLTMAHEIGHNFGSPHDTTAECLPTGSSSFYVMYPYVNPGNKPNNDKFSVCSRTSIAQNLDSVLNSRSPVKPNCFRDKLAPVCGNQVVEGTEECDCGATADECKAAKDNCCSPGDSGPFACRLLRFAKCSPSQGSCCDQVTCQLVPAASNKVCAVTSECGDQAVCTGSSPVCPMPKAKTNTTFCASKTKLCVNGECSQSVCRMIQYDECQEPFDKTQDASRYCYLSCQPNTGGNKKCLNSLDPSDDFIFKHLIDQVGGGKPIKLPPGSPCDNYQGVCDVFSRCRLINVQGPFARIFSVLSGDSKVDSAGKWLVRYWWVIAICSVAFIAISFCLLKYCSDLLPTSNPKFQAEMSRSEALRSVFKPSLRRRPRMQSLAF